MKTMTEPTEAPLETTSSPHLQPRHIWNQCNGHCQGSCKGPTTADDSLRITLRRVPKAAPSQITVAEMLFAG
jgi:hypothetical protein